MIKALRTLPLSPQDSKSGQLPIHASPLQEVDRQQLNQTYLPRVVGKPRYNNNLRASSSWMAGDPRPINAVMYNIYSESLYDTVGSCALNTPVQYSGPLAEYSEPFGYYYWRFGDNKGILWISIQGVSLLFLPFHIQTKPRGGVCYLSSDSSTAASRSFVCEM